MLLAAALVIAQPLLIRRAEVDISPPEPLPLGGYTERHGKVMEPGGEPLFARCIEMEQGDTKVAIVSVEMLTIPESLYREVAARIPKDVHLFMQATHTHCAPDSQMLNERMTFAVPGIASFKKRWLTWYAERISSVVNAALTERTAQPLWLLVSKSIVSANRARRQGGKPDPALTKVLMSDTPPLEPTFGEELLFTHYTAHPTIYGPEENKTRGDWPGLLAQRTRCPVLNGAIGDVSPIADGRTILDKLQTFRDRLASADKSVHFLVWSLNPPSEKRDRAQARDLRWISQPIKLDDRQPHPTFARENGIPARLAQTLVAQFAPPAANIVALRIGTLAIVGVPGEPTSILGNQIKAAGERMGFKSVLVCSHVGGWMGYILDPADYGRGGYEATLSFYGRNEGSKVVGAAVAALKKLR